MRRSTATARRARALVLAAALVSIPFAIMLRAGGPPRWTVEALDPTYARVRSPYGSIVNVDRARIPAARVGDTLDLDARRRARLTPETCATDAECLAATGVDPQ